MIEHLRQERTIVNQLYGGAAQLVETSGSGAGPGRVEITVEGRPVGRGLSFREAVSLALAGTPERVLPAG